MRGFFSFVERTRGLLEVKLTQAYTGPARMDHLVFLTLELVHAEPPAIH